jgi:hypothetical protein
VGDVTEEKLVPVHPEMNAAIRNGGSQRAAGRHIIIFVQLDPQLPRQAQGAKAAPGFHSRAANCGDETTCAAAWGRRSSWTAARRSYGVLMQRAWTSKLNVISGQTPCKRLL